MSGPVRRGWRGGPVRGSGAAGWPLLLLMALAGCASPQERPPSPDDDATPTEAQKPSDSGAPPSSSLAPDEPSDPPAPAPPAEEPAPPTDARDARPATPVDAASPPARLDAAPRPTDGGASAPAAPGAASKCAGKHKICEDFEATAVGAIPTGWTRSGTVGVAEDQAFRGKRALKVSGAVFGPRRMSKSGADVTALGGSHWGRIFYRVAIPTPKTSGVIHSTLLAGAATSPIGGNIEVRMVDTVLNLTGRHQFLYNVQPADRAEFGKGSPYNWQFDGKWHCAEYRVDHATQSYRFYLDGAEVTSIAISNGAGNFRGAEIPQVFRSVSVGWNNYQNAPPGFTVWIDEVAFDPNRIGCDG